MNGVICPKCGGNQWKTDVKIDSLTIEIDENGASKKQGKMSFSYTCLVCGYVESKRKSVDQSK